MLGWTGTWLEAVVLQTARLDEVLVAGEPLMGTWTRDAITLCGPRPAQLRRGRAEGRGPLVPSRPPRSPPPDRESRGLIGLEAAGHSGARLLSEKDRVVAV